MRLTRFPVSGGPQQQMRTEQQLYYDDREKVRGAQSNSQRSNRSQQGPPPSSPRYPRGGSDRVYRQDRHTVDRERFPVKYNEPDEYHEDAEDFPPQNVRNLDGRRNGNGPMTPMQQRHMMRSAEDPQMGGSLQQHNRMPNRGGKFIESSISKLKKIYVYSLPSCSIFGPSSDAPWPSNDWLWSWAAMQNACAMQQVCHGRHGRARSRLQTVSQHSQSIYASPNSLWRPIAAAWPARPSAHLRGQRFGNATNKKR